jgi:hypothetical protein
MKALSNVLQDDAIPVGSVPMGIFYFELKLPPMFDKKPSNRYSFGT